MRRRTVSLSPHAHGLTVIVRSAAAAGNSGYLTTYRWDSDGDSLRLRVHAEPVGHRPERGDEFPDTMVDPALPPGGVPGSPPQERVPLTGPHRTRLGASRDRSQVEWFGTGVEAYPDSRQAVRVGRFRATVDELQTLYVRPQENGNRADNHAVQGLGTAAVGPGVLPQHRLELGPATSRSP
ncbi:hypothetical protein ABZZ20_08335 [Streptomyces sp. NPDC006430]|uniref:hypothetical protein n=1 Tax=Streptomyces sp. NPDC006430 TaxID=3154299 RepID=UPI0033A4C77B